jgi:hypothetical protein
MGTQWSDFGCPLFFSPQKITLLPKNYRIIISPQAPRPLRRLVTDSLYWTYLLTLLTYLLSGNCLLYYRQLKSHVAVEQTQWTYLLATKSRKVLTLSSLLAT